MSSRKKRKTSPPGEISPAIFASSVARLDVRCVLTSSSSERGAAAGARAAAAVSGNDDGESDETENGVSGRRSSEAKRDDDRATDGIDVRGYTPGAMEALRVCHSRFLASVASELASMCDASEREGGTEGKIRTVNEADAKLALANIGFADLVERTSERMERFEAEERRRAAERGIAAAADAEEGCAGRCSNGGPGIDRTAAARKRKKRKKGSAVTPAMLEEQERLLKQSVETVLQSRQS